MLLYYRGLRSVDDTYRLQSESAHTENYREHGVHCNKKNATNGIKLCLYFLLALNFRLCTLKMLQLLGDSVPRPPAGASPMDPTAE